MRLTAIELAEGWTKFTTSWELVLKDCQFRDRFWLDCVTVVVLPLWLTVPLPAVTCPPVGPAHAAWPAVIKTAVSKARLAALPLPLVHSETTIQVCWTWLQ